jgi:hypothetical protein
VTERGTGPEQRPGAASPSVPPPLTLPLTLLGAPDAAACVDGSCEVPGR